MRSKLGRTAGMCVECVGVVWDCATGVVGVERYTIPVPVRGGLGRGPVPTVFSTRPGAAPGTGDAVDDADIGAYPGPG